MMRRLREATGETVALFVPEGAFRLCISELESPQPLSFKRGVGYRERLVLGASGRAILAHMDPTAKDLKGHAKGLDIDLEKFPDELARIRERGFAVSKDELLQGAIAVAAPFFDGAERVAGSIAIFGPSVRLPAAQVDKFGKLLVQEAAQLSKALGQSRSQSK